MSDYSDLEQAKSKDKFTLRLYAFLAIPMLACAFYVIDHVWDASLYSESLFGVYDGTANRTADRMEGVNAGSSSWRILLCVFGLVGFTLVRSPKIRFSPLALSMVGYFGWLCCTLLWSTEPSATSFKLVVLAVFLLTAIGISRSLRLEQLAIRFAIVCACYLVWGVFAEVVHGRFLFLNGEYRFTGTTHPNTNSVYAAIVCFCSSLYLRRGRRIAWLPLAFFCFGLVFLVLAKSRTSIAAMLLGVTAIAAIQVQPRLRTPLIVGALTLLSFGTLAYALVGSQIMGKVGTAAAMGRKDDISTLTGRLPLWEQLTESIADSPIVGHGYLGYWTAENVENLSELLKWEIPHGHNMYLDVALDGGAVGLFFFVTMLLSGLFTGASRFLKSQDRGAAFAVGLTAFVFVHGFGESIFKLPVFPTFVLLAMFIRLAWEADPNSRREMPIRNVSAANN